MTEFEKFETFISELPANHQAALRWFAQRAGQEHSWPQPIEAGTTKIFLASKAKGIYKPKWSEFALSVRQTLGGPYPDREPVVRADGTWSFAYFQENEDPAARDDEFTNRGLVACWENLIPVGVMRQVEGRPNIRYRILGVALVAGWDAGYFYLEGLSPDGICHGPGPAAQLDVLVAERESEDDAVGVFDPQSIKDARERVVASIVRRRGQRAFRRALLDAYRGRCALTGCEVEAVLEAAHITPYRGVETNHPTNGLLLRSDIHVLFDLGLISIHPGTRQVVVSAALDGTPYGELRGIHVAAPTAQAARPSEAALADHYRWSQLAVAADGG